MSTAGRTDGRIDGRTHYYSPFRLTSGENQHREHSFTELTMVKAKF